MHCIRQNSFQPRTDLYNLKVLYHKKFYSELFLLATNSPSSTKGMFSSPFCSRLEASHRPCSNFLILFRAGKLTRILVESFLETFKYLQYLSTIVPYLPSLLLLLSDFYMKSAGAQNNRTVSTTLLSHVKAAVLISRRTLENKIHLLIEIPYHFLSTLADASLKEFCNSPLHLFKHQAH